VQRNVVVEAELELNGDDETNKRGRPKRQNNHPLVELNLRLYHLKVVAHLRSAWRRCLIGMSILMKTNVRWLHWSLPIMLYYGGRIWKFIGEWMTKRISPFGQL